MSMRVRYGARTDVGRTREHNEDSYGIGEGEALAQLGHLFVVCDGMGGHAGGEVASKLAIETILHEYYADASPERAAAIEHAFEDANARVFAQGRGTMGTTGVAALILHATLYIANVGDSRAYLIRANTIRQLSRDHSLVADQVAAGLITPEQARHSNIKNVITRAIGHQPEVEVDLFELTLHPDDWVLLCSDGLHGLVEDEELGEIAAVEDLDAACQELINLANARGGTDNITAVLVQIGALDPPAAPAPDEQPTERLDATPPHEQITEQMPVAVPSPDAQTTERMPVAAAPEDAATPPSAEPVAAAAPPAPPAPPAPAERRLNLRGALLSVLLLLVLVAAILVAQFRPELLPFATPQATPQATPLPSVVSTPAATPAQASPLPSGVSTPAAPTALPAATP